MVLSKYKILSLERDLNPVGHILSQTTNPLRHTGTLYILYLCISYFKSHS